MVEVLLQELVDSCFGSCVKCMYCLRLFIRQYGCNIITCPGCKPEELGTAVDVANLHGILVFFMCKASLLCCTLRRC
jgi:hypothetical protein